MKEIFENSQKFLVVELFNENIENLKYTFEQKMKNILIIL
jgi:hypothetical protein